MLTAKVKWAGGLEYIGESGTGHAIVLDGGVDVGGQNLGMRPMELLLVGLGGCSGMDIASILAKKRQNVAGIEATVKGRMADGYPKKFTDIEIEFTVTGKDLSEEAVKRAVDLSMEKYCSVKATLEGSTRITFSYKIVNVQ
jgi:putative redox protein